MLINVILCFMFFSFGFTMTLGLLSVAYLIRKMILKNKMLKGDK